MNGKEIYLRDIFPSSQEVKTYTDKYITPELFKENYKNLLEGNSKWKSLEVEEKPLYQWNPKSTYIRNPPYFDNFQMDPITLGKLNLHCVLLLGDTITTDHISSAGKIPRKSPTADYLQNYGI